MMKKKYVLSFFIGIFLFGNALSKTFSLSVSLDSAVTRDVDGNGYLDQIELYFNTPVSFSAGFPLTGFTVTYSGATDVAFTVDSLGAMDTSSTKYVLYLAENTSSLTGSPQTAWTPDVAINGLANAIPAVRCKDGAGPVIWSAENIIRNLSDYSQDIIRITFSEPIQGPHGSALSLASINPSIAFKAFKPSVYGSGYDTLRLFTYIDTLSRIINDSTIEIKMYFRYFYFSYYVNINGSANQIYDSRFLTGGGDGIPPVIENQKVKVSVSSSASPTGLDIFLNPSRPTIEREEAGHFSLQNNPRARSWVREDHSGISFSFNAFISKEDSTEVSLKIFDTFGSEVASAEPEKSRYLKDIDTNFNTITTVSIYWNGTSTHSPSTYVHEGIYSAELQFQQKNKKDPVVFKQNFYMEKPDSGHSTCGGNYSIAFLPALWLKSRKPLIRFFMKIRKNIRGTQ
jgi:hypothetical protein